MIRRHVRFGCEYDWLVGTLDDAPGATGLLMVTGGNETRAGAFSGQAHLAARIAAAGYPVFRFDRRGVGDSTGTNGGFRSSGQDITAGFARLLLEHHELGGPPLQRVVGFGNCDAASALMLFGGAGCDALVLANPWTFDRDDEAPPPAAIRARYAQKLRDPREVLRLVTGKVSIPKLTAGVRRALGPRRAPTTLLQQMEAGLARFPGTARILLAERDRTAQAFAAVWDPQDPHVVTCPGADHAFSGEAAQDWLFAQLIAALEGE